MSVGIGEVKSLQAQVDNGHLVGKLDPIQVSWEFLTREFLEMESSFKDKGKPSSVELAEELPEAKIVRATFDDVIVELYLTQPVRQDTTGIWVVEKYRIIEK